MYKWAGTLLFYYQSPVWCLTEQTEPKYSAKLLLPFWKRSKSLQILSCSVYLFFQGGCMGCTCSKLLQLHLCYSLLLVDASNDFENICMWFLHDSLQPGVPAFDIIVWSRPIIIVVVPLLESELAITDSWLAGRSGGWLCSLLEDCTLPSLALVPLTDLDLQVSVILVRQVTEVFSTCIILMVHHQTQSSLPTNLQFLTVGNHFTIYSRLSLIYSAIPTSHCGPLSLRIGIPRSLTSRPSS